MRSLILQAAFALVCLAGAPAAAAPETMFVTPSGVFIELAGPVVAGKAQPPVRIAVSQIIRIGLLERETVIDTTGFVQQKTSEPAETVARRLMAAGIRLIQVTDALGQRNWVAANWVVMVRAAQAGHPVGTRASITLPGLRFARDVAVKETVDEVMAALAR
ncbi:MAG: hypothetical protein ACOYOH_12975 [Paracraurococcus sp.]